jgi:hypothetical protein
MLPLEFSSGNRETPQSQPIDISPYLAAQRAKLIVQHDDLDTAIAVLMASTGSDDLLIRRLKKRKLMLRDEIEASGAVLTGGASTSAVR